MFFSLTKNCTIDDDYDDDEEVEIEIEVEEEGECCFQMWVFNIFIIICDWSSNWSSAFLFLHIASFLFVVIKYKQPLFVVVVVVVVVIAVVQYIT